MQVQVLMRKKRLVVDLGRGMGITLKEAENKQLAVMYVPSVYLIFYWKFLYLPIFLKSIYIFSLFIFSAASIEISLSWLSSYCVCSWLHLSHYSTNVYPCVSLRLPDSL